MVHGENGVLGTNAANRAAVVLKYASAVVLIRQRSMEEEIVLDPKRRSKDAILSLVP